MRPRLDLDEARQTRLWEHAVRFVFGGCIAVAAQLVEHHWGPVVGGLFLGFPSIFPAGITLVRRHEGRAKAIDDARGARLGTVGLVTFGAIVWATAASWPPAVVLGSATLAWVAVDLACWAVVYGPRRER